jgi:hypothetical protein
VVLSELADLYRLDFMTLAAWAGWTHTEGQSGSDRGRIDSANLLVRRVLDLDEVERAQVLSYIEGIHRARRT